MYQQLKNQIKNLLPQKFLFAHEESFRKILLPFYKGNKYRCNMCGTELRNFEKLENGNLLCAICGSLPRTRRLWKLLSEEFLKEDSAVLDFSPSRSLYRNLKKEPSIKYFSTDFENEFIADFRYDITNISAESETFDLIICYHILEHIIEDEKAMNELFRVLKPGGYLLVQTPFKKGDIYEDLTLTSESERQKFFGQKDHVRIYSVSGLEKRLQNSSFTIEVRHFEGDEYLGLTAGEKVIICCK